MLHVCIIHVYVINLSCSHFVPQSDCQVPMLPSSASPQLPNLTDQQLSQIRKYLVIARMLDYKISDTIKKVM